MICSAVKKSSISWRSSSEGIRGTDSRNTRKVESCEESKNPRKCFRSRSCSFSTEGRYFKASRCSIYMGKMVRIQTFYPMNCCCCYSCYPLNETVFTFSRNSLSKENESSWSSFVRNWLRAEVIRFPTVDGTRYCQNKDSRLLAESIS